MDKDAEDGQENMNRVQYLVKRDEVLLATYYYSGNSDKQGLPSCFTLLTTFSAYLAKKIYILTLQSHKPR